jgi:hypothetical protein
MKRIVGLIILAFIAGNIFAQKIDQKNVPAVIVNSFQVKFPTAEDVEWRLDKGTYRVKFEVNNKNHEVRLDERGNFVKHLQDLYVSEIPKVVLETIREKVPFFDVEDADKITENGKTTFEINFEIDDKDHDFWISEKGKLLKYRKELKNSEIPTEIQNLIKIKYGNLDVDRTEYIEENGTILYYLKGEINDKDHEFTFEGKTKILQHKQDLRDNEIPDLILSSVKKWYSGYEIRDADLREDSTASFYIIQLRKSKENLTVTFNQKGDLIDTLKRP